MAYILSHGLVDAPTSLEVPDGKISLLTLALNVTVLLLELPRFTLLFAFSIPPMVVDPEILSASVFGL